jgi:hypothetical protein
VLLVVRSFHFIAFAGDDISAMGDAAPATIFHHFVWRSGLWRTAGNDLVSRNGCRLLCRACGSSALLQVSFHTSLAIVLIHSL